MLNLQNNKMDTVNELKIYYDQKVKYCREYLDNQLNQFKDANNKYLSSAISQACEEAEALLTQSNAKVFEAFYVKMVNLEQKRKDNYPLSVLSRMAELAKKNLESSLKFNQSLFEQSIAYYQNLLKK